MKKVFGILGTWFLLISNILLPFCNVSFAEMERGGFDTQDKCYQFSDQNGGQGLILVKYKCDVGGGIVDLRNASLEEGQFISSIAQDAFEGTNVSKVIVPSTVSSIGNGAFCSVGNEGGPICGNGIIESGEDCDDGGDNGIGCTSECTRNFNGHLTVYKVTTSTPANGNNYALGEEILYEITVTNDGNLTITDIVVEDELTGDEWEIASLTPGESKTLTASYTVTEADVLAGEVVNVATARGISPDPDEPDVPVAPGEDLEPTENINLNNSLTNYESNGINEENFEDLNLGGQVLVNSNIGGQNRNLGASLDTSEFIELEFPDGINDELLLSDLSNACAKLIQYNVTFVDDQGIELGIINVTYGETLNIGDIPIVPSKVGYIGGWYLGNELFDFDNQIYSAITLVYKYKSSGGFSGGGGSNSSNSNSSNNSENLVSNGLDNSGGDTSENSQKNGQDSVLSQDESNLLLGEDEKLLEDITHLDFQQDDENKDVNLVSQNDLLQSYDSSSEKTIYSPEYQQAYKFAKENGITTMVTIQDAKMEGKLTRIQMAKMLSQYAINVLGEKPDTTKNVKFKDVTNKMDERYDNGVTLAYQLGIMGQNMPRNRFRPNDEVSRAEFVTALSRMLYQTSDGEYEKTARYYMPHMAKLYNEGIVNDTNPSMKERRGYVMIMLMRSVNNG